LAPPRKKSRAIYVAGMKSARWGSPSRKSRLRPDGESADWLAFASEIPGHAPQRMRKLKRCALRP